MLLFIVTQERFHRDGERVYRFLMVHGYINSGQFASVEQKTECMYCKIYHQKS